MLPIEVVVTNEGATRQLGEPDHPPVPAGGHTIWFRWEATSTEAVTIATCGTEIPTILGVYVGDSLGALTEVGGGTRAAGGCPFYEGTQATFRAVSGKTYSIQLDGNTYNGPSVPPSSGEGEIKLQIRHQQPPPNDAFIDAKPLQFDALATAAPNLGATKEPGEPDHGGDPGGASVWFKFTAPRTGGAFVDVYGSRVGRDGILDVYTGDSVSNLTSVPVMEPWGSRSEVGFPITAGITYSIALDGHYDPVTETAVMEEPEILLRTYPRNDAFEDAFDLTSGPLGGTSGINGLGSAGATKQPGEPDHAGNRGGSSVWFTWTAPASGSAQLSACGASFDTLVAVYTGSSVGNLTPVAASRNPQSPGCTMGITSAAGEVGFNVDAGIIYRIAVDGYEGAWGRFGIELKTSTKRLSSPLASGLESSGSGHPPRTKISRRHLIRRRGIAIFHLSSSQPGSRFMCRLDKHRFRACSSKIVYKRLNPGRHAFASKAINSSGEADPTPAVFRFRIGR